MIWLHFLHLILKTFPRTFSSAIEYFVAQLSQTIFIGVLAQNEQMIIENAACGRKRSAPLHLDRRARGNLGAPVSETDCATRSSPPAPARRTRGRAGFP